MVQKTSIEPAVQVLLDKQEICELLAHYCRGVDRCDDKLLRSIFLPDAMVDYCIFEGSAPEFCDWVLNRLKTNYKVTMHRISNTLLEVEGDTAHGETYCCAFHRLMQDGKDFDLICGLRYIDRFQKSEGVWKISNRRVVYDWNRVDPSTEQFSTGYEGSGYKGVTFIMGSRGPNDLSYPKDS